MSKNITTTTRLGLAMIHSVLKPVTLKHLENVDINHLANGKQIWGAEKGVIFLRSAIKSHFFTDSFRECLHLQLSLLMWLLEFLSHLLLELFQVNEIYLLQLLVPLD